MRADGLQGVSPPPQAPRKAGTATHDDLVKRHFRADAPNRLWLIDITQHPRERARSIAPACSTPTQSPHRGLVDHRPPHSGIVVDALEMARWRRRPEPGTVVHADRGAQYTSGGSSGTGSAKGAWAARWAESRPASTTRSSKASGRRCNASSWTAPPGIPGRSSPGVGDVRVDRGVLQPSPPTHQPGRSQPCRLRSTSHRRRNRGMINT